MRYTYRLLSVQEHGLDYGLKQAYAVQRGNEEIGRIARCDRATYRGRMAGSVWYHVTAQGIAWCERFSRRDDAAVMLDWQRHGWVMAPGALAQVSRYLKPYGGVVEYADLTPEVMAQLQACRAAEDAALAARWA